MIKVVDSNEKHKQSTKENVWENKERFSLYHDTRNKVLKVVIGQLGYSGEYKCKFHPELQSSSDEEGEQEVEVKGNKKHCFF